MPPKRGAAGGRGGPKKSPRRRGPITDAYTRRAAAGSAPGPEASPRSGAPTSESEAEAVATAVVVLQRWGAAGSSSCSSEGTAPVRGGGGATMRAQARRPDAQALVPVPMRSNLRRGLPRLVPRLREQLRAYAAARIWAYMITDAAHMSINAPFSNEPKPEALLNTKAMVAQYSRTAGVALAASQGGSRVCLGCHDEARGASSRGEHCDAGGAACAGCVACVGRLFSCPSCGRDFTMRWACETGSTTAWIGRDPSSFAVHEMPPTLCHTLHALERSRSVGSPLYAHNNCVLLAYTGADFCAGCAPSGVGATILLVVARPRSATAS